MVNEILTQWQTENHLNVKENFIYGNYNNIGFTVNEEGEGILFVFTLEAQDDSSYRGLQKNMESKGGILATLQVGKVENYLALFITHVSEKNQLSAIVDFVAHSAAENGFSAPQLCFLCDAPASKLKFLDGLVRPVCAECKSGRKKFTAPEQHIPIEEVQREENHEPPVEIEPVRVEKESFAVAYNDDAEHMEKEDSEWEDSHEFIMKESEDYYSVLMEDDDFDYGVKKSLNGHFITGLIGAFIGALIGVVPYILMYHFAEMPIAALCLISGSLSMLFYILFRGRKVKGLGIALSLLFSIIVSFIAVFAVQNNVELVQSGVSLTENLQSIGTNLEFWINEAMAVIGAVLGAFVFKGSLKNYCK